MALHRAKHDDWHAISPEKRNSLQHVAARTKGIVTLPNVITLIGGGLVLYGLILLRDDKASSLFAGTVCIIIGRLLDIVDGYVADWTKTKSPVGEALDAAVDKIVLIAAVLVLMEQQLVPAIVGTSMFVQAAYVAALSLLAQLHSSRLHPSIIGKQSVWFEWCAIGLLLLSRVFQDQQLFSTLLSISGWLAFTGFIILGTLASVRYTQTYYRARTAATGK